MSRRLLLAILRPSSGRFTALHTLPDLPNNALARRISPRVASRHASTELPPKTIVLEKPDKFRPPSHPQRLNRKPSRQYPGPPLSESEREAQKTKRYPHMFPNEGTKLHWFLTNKWIHLWISLVREILSHRMASSDGLYKLVTQCTAALLLPTVLIRRSGHTFISRSHNFDTVLLTYLAICAPCPTNLLLPITPYQLCVRMVVYNPSSR